MQERRIQWFGHPEEMEENALSIKCETLRDSGSIPRQNPGKIWNEVIRNDLKERKASKNLPKDSNASKSIRNRLTHANIEERLKQKL